MDNYTDGRFSAVVLRQHGGFLIDGEPYEVEIISPDTAVVRGMCADNFSHLAEEFRFYAPHICRFADEKGDVVAEYPPPELISVALDEIQPSQFYADEEKLAAVSAFIHAPEDIVIQVKRWGDRCVSLDGHTRLYLAVQRGYDSVRAAVSESDDWVWRFVHEARARGVYTPRDLKLLSHEEYEREWNGFCDRIFACGDGENV